MKKKYRITLSMPHPYTGAEVEREYETRQPSKEKAKKHICELFPSAKILKIKRAWI